MTVKKANKKSRKIPNSKGKTEHPTPRSNNWTDRTPVADWTENATAADVKRIIWKCVFGVQRKKLSPKQANSMIYGLSLIKDFMETEDFERRLAQLEDHRGGNDGGVISISVSK